MSDDLRLESMAAIGEMFEALAEGSRVGQGFTTDDVSQMLDVIGKALGYMPEVAGRVIKGLAWCVKTEPDVKAAATAEVTPPKPSSRRTKVTPTQGTSKGANASQKGGGDARGAPKKPGPEFDEIVGPVDDNSTPTVDLDGDEVDIDAVFGGE
jgi:hypothetical protein